MAGVFINQIIERRAVGFPDEAPARRQRQPVEHVEQEEEELSFPVQESAVEEREALNLKTWSLYYKRYKVLKVQASPCRAKFNLDCKSAKHVLYRHNRIAK